MQTRLAVIVRAIAIVSVVTLAFAAVNGGESEAREPETYGLLAAGHPLPGATCQDCVTCSGGSGEYPHKASTGDDSWSIEHSTCATCPGCSPGACPPHQACGGTLENDGGPSALIAAARQGDRPGLTRFLAAPNVQLNVNRHAIQVIGCKGDVVMHVELTPQNYAELTQFLNRWDVRLGLAMRRTVRQVAARTGQAALSEE